MRKLPETYLAHLDRIPPCVCYLIARRNGVMMTLPQIAAESGLGARTVRRISRSASWAAFTVDQVDRFRMACGITVKSEKVHMRYLKRNARSIAEGGGMRSVMRAGVHTRRSVTLAMRIAAAERLRLQGRTAANP